MPTAATQRYPTLEFVTRLQVEIDSPLELGQAAEGRRRFIPITGGSFSGPGLSGRILAGGGDWQTLRQDGTAVLEARYFLQTHEGDFIEVTNTGYRHASPAIMERLLNGEIVAPEEYYFQTTPRLQTASKNYDWLNRTIFIGDAERMPDSVIVNLFAVN
ncbi:DUF3237 domain-containing protein [Modicisalibacter xianhensis]|uniref:UPF0311 protein SAMN04487959_1255 n=1 Tax=Modicisalibacter xianhensis TaxID=442341 RepID=A0A1I3G3F4_9GAMM|nr:DUF3237 domain-containing protein [Halomonas xianhensis]SFI18009.1 Protein of unknown function [Halomonas xianhensis]